MDDENKGYGHSNPLYVVDEKTGELIQVYLPADAVASEAKPGVKAGNPLLDEINQQLREEQLIEKMRRLYIKNKK
ncbi:MAG: hypothetical protein PHH54_02105 [Candidatus Nanoarchaeia archaeon]|nr:hypothetical protein [Candidatus Nanoarchaeia archaeon]MDD5740755.1 hypothetical protein [Candidatus Nanoarchaeia archaeon]